MAFFCAIFLLILQVPERAFSQLDSILSKPVKTLTVSPFASDIETDEEGNLFVLQSSKHKLQKYFKSNAYDSVLTIGGKGVGKEGFNLPRKICVPNRQNLFLLDQMNMRVVVLNTNLKIVDDVNFLTIDINSLEEESSYLNPVSFTAGPTGDLYILNLDDIRVYKLDNEGLLKTTFGGLDFGEGSLVTPDDITINRDNFVFISDSARQVITVYDLFGIYQYKIEPMASFRWQRVVAVGKYLICFGGNRILFLDLFTKSWEEVKLKSEEHITDISVTRENLFILSGSHVNLYPIPN